MIWILKLNEISRYPAFQQSKKIQVSLNIFEDAYGVKTFGPVILHKIQRQKDNEDLDKKPQSSTRRILDDIIPNGIWKNVYWNGWELPGNGSPLKTCKKIMILGCIHKIDHPGKKTFINTVRKSCYRSSCSLCYESWMNRQANRMTARIYEWMKICHFKIKPSHVTISLPENMYSWDDKKITKYLKPILKQTGISGGYKILHPWRFDKKTFVPYLSVHLHIIAFGWIKNTDKIYEKTGIVIKKISTLKTEGDVFNTCKYQLSHCAVKGHRHAAVPFGSISYSKLKIPKPEIEPILCPYCERELVTLRLDPYAVDRPPSFDEEFIGLTAFTGFVPIEKYDVVYYNDDWSVATSSKQMSIDKMIEQERIKKINDKIERLKIKNKLILKIKSKYCAVLDNWIKN